LERSVRATFYLPGEDDLDRLRRIDPDRDWLEFARGHRAWILQTYLRLAAAGHDVDLADEPPRDGMLVFHANQVESLLRYWWRWGDCLMIAVRADHSESHLADFELVQNRVWVDGSRRFFVPFWPQPGLVPRDPARGARIERVAFKGFIKSLHPAFASQAMADELRRRGIELMIDAVDYRGAETDGSRLRWADYRDVDLVLAVRPPIGTYTDKPASKLYNAWRAGVPALLGPEPAFRELYTDPLDYVEVSTVDEVLAAIDRLRAEPDLYLRMIDRGRQRAVEFSPEAVLERWVDVLWRRIPALARERPWHSFPPWIRPALRRAERLIEGRPSR
jgi:hypothetical protein